jgi:hypothetical protein
MRPVEPRPAPWIARSGARFSTGVLALAALFALPSASCKRKDPEKCQQGISVARQALAGEDFALAKQWREYAWKNCEDQTPLQSFDQDLVNKEAEVTRRKTDEAAKAAERKGLLDLFTRWVSQSRMAPQTASSAFRCDPPPPPPPGKKPEDVAKDHFCSATRAAGKYQLNVRYWEAEPDVVRFSTRPASPASCADLGEHREIRTWNVAAPGGQAVKRTHCEFTSGPLAGLQGITSAAIADVFVFSPKYAQRDPRILQ